MHNILTAPFSILNYNVPTFATKVYKNNVLDNGYFICSQSDTPQVIKKLILSGKF